MGCVQVDNCNEYPEYPCFETEQKCKCGCPGSGVDPKAEECKCLDTKCVGGTIEKKDKDCPCRCPAGQFLANGVCTPFQYNCNANNGTCYAVRANGAYATQQACRDAGCRGAPPPGGPPCWPTPLPPAGIPLMCPPSPRAPAGRQYGLIMYTFNPAECEWTPIQIIWSTCEEPPEPPPGSSSATSSSSSSSSLCDCGALFDGIAAEVTEVCGQQVVSVGIIQPFWQGVQSICGGSISTYEYCDTCDHLGRPVLKDVTILIPCKVISDDLPCALCPVPVAPGVIPPGGCPSSSSTSYTPVSSSSSSSLTSASSVSASSAVSYSSSSSCAATGPTSINFSANSGSGQYLNKFGPGDFINVAVTVSDAAAAEEAQTAWTFFANVGNTEYPINSGDITVGQYPINFTVSSETLLGLLGLTFETAPTGYYSFPLCARAINCTGLTDEQCRGAVTVVVTGGQTNTSSSSGTTTSSSTTTSSTTSSTTTTSSSSTGSSTSGSSAPTSSRLLYFTGASGGATATRWDVLTNWRLGSPVGPAATQLPTTIDDVVIIASVYSNVGAAACVRDMTVLDTAYTGISIEMIVYASGVVRFYGGAMIGNNVSAGRIGEVHGNATFYDFSGNFGLVDGNATFMNDSYNDDGEINGQAIFNDDSILSAGIVRCNAEFNNNAARGGGAVYGTVTCNTSLACYTTSAGACNNTTPETCPP